MQPIDISEIPDQIIEHINEITSLRFPRQGCTSDVAIIESKGNLFALKRTKDPLYRSWLSKEVAVLNSLTSSTVLPVPKVKVFVCDDAKNQSWALLEFIEGETLRSTLVNEKNIEIRRELIFKFGEVLRQIHSTPCPEELITDKPWLDEMLTTAKYNLTHYKVDGTAEILERIEAIKLTSRKSTLIHGDFTIDNVLVNDGKISGVIDWAGGAYGDSRYDASLAIRPKPNAFQNKRDTDVFFEGYGDKIVDDITYDYYVNGLYEFF